MAQMTSGKVLRDAREREGYDLATVARRLRIRPDILRAIEEGDFAAMPPRGYTRNMVNAYARLLGLNATEIVNMYLDEAYAKQVERARGHGPSSGFNMERESRRTRSRTQRNEAVDESAAYQSQRRSAGSRTGSYPARDLYDDRTQFSRDDYGVTRERTARTDRSERDFMSHHSGYSSATSTYYRDNLPKRGNRDIHVGQTPMHYTASRVPPFLKTRMGIVIVVAVVLIIAIVIAVFVLGGRNEPVQDDVSQLPVSGISDTTGGDEGASTSEPVVEVAPTSARVVYSVGTGEECYIQTYTDGGDMQAEMLSGPLEKTLEITGTWTVSTWSPDTLKLTVNGEDVALQIDENYGGMYAYTVDFQKILEEWKSTHNSKSERRSAAVASANVTSGEEESSDESASASAASADSESSKSSELVPSTANAA